MDDKVLQKPVFKDYGETVVSDTVTGSVSGYHLVFDGSGDYVSMGDPAGGELDFGSSQDFSVSFWFKTSADATSLSWPGFVSKEDNGVDSPRVGWNLHLSSTGGVENTLGFETLVSGTQDIVHTTSTVNDGDWHHVVCVRDTSAAKLLLYFDGDTPTEATSINTGSLVNSIPFALGVRQPTAQTANTFLACSLDDVRVYNAALSASNVAALYIGEDYTTNIVGFWDLDEGTGNASDSSGNGNTGILNGSTTWTSGDGHPKVKDETLDIREGNIFNITLENNAALTFANPPANGTAGSFTLYLTQDATGGRAIAWPSAVAWLAGSEPTLNTASNALNILSFFTVDGGTVWYGAYAGGVSNSPTSVAFFASNFDNNASNSTDWSISLPPSLQDGDLGVIYTTVDQNRNDNPTTHPPSGWTVLGTTQGVDSEYPECWVYGKILTSAESSSTVTITGQVADSHSTAVIVFRGDQPISSFGTAQDFNSEDGASALTLCDTDPSGETDAISLCLAYSCGRPITPQYPTLSSSPTEDGQEASSGTGQRISYHIFNGSGHTAINNSVTDTGRQVGVAFYLNLT